MLLECKLPGETMEQFIKRIKETYSVKKLAYTARLDPMAKGYVPILVNDECLKVKEHLNSKKTYQVKIIYGLQTDSDDPLGIITTKIDITKDNYSLITKYITDYLNLISDTSFFQKYHFFSTKMLNHRRLKSLNVKDYHSVNLYKYCVIKEGVYDYELWKNKVIEKINFIDNTKNFRQEQTINQWNEMDLDSLYYLKISLFVSCGFFVRQLIRDISDNIGFPLMCYNINRVSID
jgi:tRNA U55 pseudouridine synthase TruB